jgi:hypothetical protein
MADLSNLLGNVYGDDGDDDPAARETAAPEATSGARPAPEATGAAPAWADESVLDAAFANWTPGPPLDAPAAERHVFFPSVDPASAPPLPDDLAAALSAALVGAPRADVPLIAAPVVSTPAMDVDLPPSPSSSAPVDPAVDGGASWADLAATRRADVADHDDPFADSMPLTGRLPWQRGDDDILPRRASSSRRGRSSLRLRRK